MGLKRVRCVVDVWFVVTGGPRHADVTYLCRLENFVVDVVVDLGFHVVRDFKETWFRMCMCMYIGYRCI